MYRQTPEGPGSGYSPRNILVPSSTFRTWEWSPTPQSIMHIHNDMNINIDIDIHITIDMNIENYWLFYHIDTPLMPC